MTSYDMNKYAEKKKSLQQTYSHASFTLFPEHK